MGPTLDAVFHVAEDRGTRLYLHHRPSAGQPVRGCVVAVHAFAEEMNKSRRMVAQAARALAADGWAVLLPDLAGCGDSGSEFGDARWDVWVDDVAEAARWLHRHHPDVPLWLWGHRNGALLAAEAMTDRLSLAPHLLLWQPVLQGKTAFQQFLRLKAAAQLADGGGKQALDAARTDLVAGRSVDIAGYALAPSLAQGWQAATLAPPDATAEGTAGPSRHLIWLEVSSQPAPEPSPAAKAALPRWQAAGWTPQLQAVPGPPFWQTAEIEDAPALVSATVAALNATAPAAMGASHRVSGLQRETHQSDTPPDQRTEQALTFACEGEVLVGVLHAAASDTGVVIVVGGPQYRVGSHRQFVQLARALAAAGHPTLRFDVRGMGDSTGPLHTFEQITPDIGAAVDALMAAQPQLRRVVLWGLCDGASAALMYCAARRDARIGGLCLANPWVRSAQSLAQTRVKHYYLQRLTQRSFWLKLVSGKVAGGAVTGLLKNLRAAKARPAPGAADLTQTGPFQRRMLAGWTGQAGPILLLLSGQDYTAKEFIDYTQANADWRAALGARHVTRVDIAQADHTFSNEGSHRAAEASTVTWLRQLASAA